MPRRSRLHLGNPIADAITNLEFAPRSDNLLVSSWDSSLRLYDVKGSVLRVEAPSEAALLDCCFSGDDVAFSVGSDGCVRRYDLNSGAQDVVGRHEDMATHVESSGLSCQVVTAGFDRNVRLWDTRMDHKALCSKDVNAIVESMSLAGFDLLVATGSLVNQYDIRSLEGPVWGKEVMTGNIIRCISSSLDLKGFVAGSVDGHVAVEIFPSPYSHPNGYIFKCRPKVKNGKHHLVSVNSIAFNPLRVGSFVTGDDQGYISVWDALTKNTLLELPRLPNSVASLAFNHNSRLLAVASSFTYQEANELEEHPEIFIYEMDQNDHVSFSGGRSAKK
ncbi:hypothetical protein MLD38_007446 [Melastoma candidum]|uniref:Uncharacterized protein n=1 Tax=Melastoma candidum TaxID=119954 RepID=A0ACB9RRA9_9MYRT|nr:hypothetical protein MLD38_007446 [Melastoma candidum]